MIYVSPRVGPLQDPVTWYGINYAETQMTQWDFQNGLDWEEFLCSFVLKVSLRYLRFSCFVFSLFPLSEDKEKDILVRINSCPKALYHDPVARRFRRKLILRQVQSSPQAEGRSTLQAVFILFSSSWREKEKGERMDARNLGVSSALSLRALLSQTSSWQFLSCPVVYVCCPVHRTKGGVEYKQFVVTRKKDGNKMAAQNLGPGSTQK